MTIEVELPDGSIAEFPDGTQPQVIEQALRQQFAQPQQQQTFDDVPTAATAPQTAPSQQPGLIQRVGETIAPFIGAAEATGALLSGAAVEPLAGAAGLIQTFNPLAPEGAGARTVEAVRTLAPTPQTAGGQASLQRLATDIEPFASTVQAAEQGLGQAGFELAGPVGGAAGETAITAAETLLGGIVARGAGRLRRTIKARPNAEQQQLLQAGETLKTPVLTSDVLPPNTFAGKSLQQIGEKLGPLGTGGRRAAQQRARSDIVVELADEFDASLDAPFETDIIKSLKSKQAAELQAAAIQRNRAVDSLSPLGDVPVSRSIKAIDNQIAAQNRLGAKADQSQIDNLNNIKESIQNKDFSVLKDVRQEVISDLKAIARGEDRRAAAALQNVKSSIDKDMVAFARTNSPEAAKDWLRSNRKFAFELSKARNTELKRLIESGEITPERVGPILKGGKLSELQRLNKSLTSKGQRSAQAAIMRNALQESGFFSGDPNPDRLATALRKPNMQKAVNTFFDADAKKRLDGLARLLDSTRRAQQASLSTPTGQQLIAPALAAGGVVDPFTTALTGGTLAAVAKGFESRPVRSLLLKIANTKKGSKAELDLIRAAGPLVASIQAPQVDNQEQVAP
jgi:hypothetical protein